MLASLLALVAGSPLDTLKTLDCNARRLAIKFADRSQPWRAPNADLHDALRISVLCGDARPVGTSQVEAARQETLASPFPPASCADDCYYVRSSLTFGAAASAASTNEGVGSTRVYTSIAAALVAVRAARHLERTHDTASSPSKSIVLQDGVHFLNATQVLTAADSGTTITGANGAASKAWISGAKALPQDLDWKPSTIGPPGVWVADLSTSTAGKTILSNLPTPPSLNTMAKGAEGVPGRLTNARFPNANPETAQWGYDSFLNKNWSIEAAVVDHWVKPAVHAVPTYTFVDLAVEGNPSGHLKNNSAMKQYNTYTHGSGGVCDTVWDPEEPSYWCSNASAGGWAEVDFHAAAAGQLNLPVGMVINISQGSRAAHFAKWKGDVSGAVVHAWHSQSWFTNSFTVESAKLATGELKFSGGGQQGGRNWCRCDQCSYAGPWCGQKQDPPINNDTRLISGSWYVEGMLDELDIPGEFYFDRKAGKLYVFANTTAVTEGGGVPASLSELVVPLLPVLVSLKGASASAPVTDVSITHVGFRDASKTIMHKWAAPSGGDWAMHRGGALFIENAENITVYGSRFNRVDGNAVFLSRHTRDVTVERCDFEWLGMGGVTTWGETEGFDVSKRTVPLRTNVIGNFFRELGIWEKQSSAVGLAKSALTRIEGNFMFNMPRAAINFNDGMGGANNAMSNLIFNTCRESGDHGALNSWDRMPFLHDLTPTGGHSAAGKTFDTLPNHISNNFIFANYGSSEGIDNDDGSSSYYIDSNVFYWADGFKMDYGGHDSKFTNNVILSIPYDGQNCVNLAGFLPGHGHSASNNTCAVGIGGHHTGSGCGDPTCINVTRTQLMDHVVHLSQCDGTVQIHGNRYYSPSGNTTVSCGSEMTLKEAQAKYPIEKGSTGGTLPTAEVMTGWMKDRLGL